MKCIHNLPHNACYRCSSDAPDKVAGWKRRISRAEAKARKERLHDLQMRFIEKWTLDIWYFREG